jgi:hypothetical protein
MPKTKWPPNVGKWTPTANLGIGGNGEVWRARSEGGPDIAIKYLRRISDEGYRRFRSEVAIMGNPAVLSALARRSTREKLILLASLVGVLLWFDHPHN